MADDQNSSEAGSNETGQQTPPEPTDGWENSTGKGGKEAVLADLHTAREKAKSEAKARADLEKRLKEYEDRDKSELQKWQERAESAEKAITAATRKAVAAANGIPGELADAIKGETEEEMAAHAKELAKHFQSANEEKTANFLAGRRGTPVAPKTDNVDDWFRNQLTS